MDILSKLLTVIGFLSVIVNGGDYVCRKGRRFSPPLFFSYSFFSEGCSRICRRNYNALQIANIFGWQIGVSGWRLMTECEDLCQAPSGFLFKKLPGNSLV